MTGWRIGWIAGNAEVVERYRQLKTNLDSGMFDALQLAGVAALTEARDFPQEMSEVYRRRRDLMIDALAGDRDRRRAAPGDARTSGSASPRAYDSASFTELVLEQAAVIVSPGPSFGPSGEGYVRISLTVPDERLEEAARRIASSLGDGQSRVIIGSCDSSPAGPRARSGARARIRRRRAGPRSGRGRGARRAPRARCGPPASRPSASSSSGGPRPIRAPTSARASSRS